MIEGKIVRGRLQRDFFEHDPEVVKKSHSTVAQTVESARKGPFPVSLRRLDSLRHGFRPFIHTLSVLGEV